jgi:TRAP-type C4-dicarboxylate transport system permease small subunit
VIERISAAWGRLLNGLALGACSIILLMTLMICADVLLRNLRIVPGMQGLAWSNEVSEWMLYLITMLSAPWLLRRGQHIRVDIVLRAIPQQAGWYCEWVADTLGLGCCVVMAYYGARAALASFYGGSLSIKTLVLPEWWILAPLPIAFALLAVEMTFRMRRLYLAERAPRDDAVTAG